MFHRQGSGSNRVQAWEAVHVGTGCESSELAAEAGGRERGSVMNIQELKRLAEKATPGPWIAGGPSFGDDLPAYFDDVLVEIEGDTGELHECDSVCVAPHGLEDESSENMLYIAAANPSTILELIAEVEYRTEKAREHFDAFQACNEELKAVKAQRDELLHAILIALPFVEDHEGSTLYKPGSVAEALRKIREVIAKAESAS